jgi:hypothetical protein
MKAIEGTSISNLGFEPQKLGDLLYFEGPLLSLFRDASDLNQYYLYKWADGDDDCNRWIVLPVRKIDLITFFEKEITLRRLFERSERLYLLDLDDGLDQKGLLETTPDRLPDSYLPREGSFFSEEKYNPFASTMKKYLADASLFDVLNVVLNELAKVRKDYRQTNDRLKLLIDLLSKKSEKSPMIGFTNSIYSPYRQINENILN